MSQGPTADPSRPTAPSYIPPPPVYYAPPNQLAPAAPYDSRRQGSSIRLGEWLVDGWHIYKENWGPMSFGALLGGFLSVCTAGVMAGPLLLGLFRMAFKTMRGERPFLGDLFNWEGRFLPAFLVFLFSALLHAGTIGLFRHEFLVLLTVDPFLLVSSFLTIAQLQDTRKDLATAINDAARRVFSRDALMWWVVGFVFMILSWMGFAACFVGIFVTFPWIVSASASAYRDTFCFDDPNRTNQ
ncbi:MAG TPA: hypothetical protein VEZ90_15990 [Blastocatellia bacterium]|nr:hypothetical protein [Blastocatellia bacterium]